MKRKPRSREKCYAAPSSRDAAEKTNAAQVRAAPSYLLPDLPCGFGDRTSRLEVNYLFILRRSTPPIPIRPVPRRNMEVGSGVIWLPQSGHPLVSVVLPKPVNPFWKKCTAIENPVVLPVIPKALTQLPELNNPPLCEIVNEKLLTALAAPAPPFTL